MTENHSLSSLKKYMSLSIVYTSTGLKIFSDDTKEWLSLSYLGAGWAGSHLYFLIDLLEHPRDDVLTLHCLDLLSGWPDILQKYLFSLCIYPWGKMFINEKNFTEYPLFIIT